MPVASRAARGLERVEQLAQVALREGVAALRAVHRDPDGVAVVLDQQVLVVGHTSTVRRAGPLPRPPWSLSRDAGHRGGRTMAATEYLTTPDPGPDPALGVGRGARQPHRARARLRLPAPSAAGGRRCRGHAGVAGDRFRHRRVERAVALAGGRGRVARRPGRRRGADRPRGPRPPRGAALLPIWGAGAAVTVLIAGYLGYGAAERATFAVAVAAQARGDCATATPAFDAVTGALSADARRRRPERGRPPGRVRRLRRGEHGTGHGPSPPQKTRCGRSGTTTRARC